MSASGAGARKRRSTTRCSNTFPASDPVSIEQPAPASSKRRTKPDFGVRRRQRPGRRPRRPAEERKPAPRSGHGYPAANRAISTPAAGIRRGLRPLSSCPAVMSPPMTTQARDARLSIGFINWAHALDHYVMLIFPTVVIGLELIYGRSYAELIALGTASFVAFGIFSLPAGWLADRWSRRNMMVLFYAGCGLSLVAAGFAPNLIGTCGRAVRARRVRRDLPSGRHRDADRAGDRARALARLQRRVRQCRRRAGGRRDGGAGRGVRMARGVPGAGRDLHCDRGGLPASRSEGGAKGGEPRHGGRRSARLLAGSDDLRPVHRDRALCRPRVQHHLGRAAENPG